MFAGADGILGTADDVVTAHIDCGAGAQPSRDLAPGNYHHQINLAGTTSLGMRMPGNPNNISVSLAAGQTASAQDFKATVALGVIGDTVWIDANKTASIRRTRPGCLG